MSSLNALLWILALGLLVWISAADVTAMAGAHRLLWPLDVTSVLLNQNFDLWHLAIMIAVVVVLVIARFKPAQIAATSGSD